MLKIVFFVAIFIVIGIAFSKIKISIEKIEINIFEKVSFNVKIGIYLFGFLKIFEIKADEIGLKILKIRIPYQKILKVSIDTYILEHLKKKDIIEFEEMDVKLDLAKFTLKIGTEDIFITVFLVTTVSSVIAELLKKKINYKKIYYKVTPEFNKNLIYYEGKIVFSIKIASIISTIKENNIKKCQGGN